MKKINKRLGDILIEKKLLTSEQLQQALDEQKKSHFRLGHTLIDLGFITEDQLLKVLTEQFQIPALKLDKNLINPQVVRLIPANICRKYNIIPFLLHNNELTIATVDPFNLDFIQEVKFISAYEIKLLLTTEKSIQETISKYMGKTENFVLDKKNTQVSEIKISIPKLIQGIFVLAIKNHAKEIQLEYRNDHATAIFFAEQVDIKLFKIDKVTYDALLTKLKIMANLDSSKKNSFLEGIFQTNIKGIPFNMRVYFFSTPMGATASIKIN